MRRSQSGDRAAFEDLIRANARLVWASVYGWVKDPKEKPGYVEAFKRSDFAAMMNYYRANYPRGTGEAVGPAPSYPPIKAPVLVCGARSPSVSVPSRAPGNSLAMPKSRIFSWP